MSSGGTQDLTDIQQFSENQIAHSQQLYDMHQQLVQPGNTLPPPNPNSASKKLQLSQQQQQKYLSSQLS